MVAMSDWYGFLLNKNKGSWRNKDIEFDVGCSIGHSIWLRGHSQIKNSILDVDPTLVGRGYNGVTSIYNI